MLKTNFLEISCPSKGKLDRSEILSIDYLHITEIGECFDGQLEKRSDKFTTRIFDIFVDSSIVITIGSVNSFTGGRLEKFRELCNFLLFFNLGFRFYFLSFITSIVHLRRDALPKLSYREITDSLDSSISKTVCF